MTLLMGLDAWVFSIAHTLLSSIAPSSAELSLPASSMSVHVPANPVHTPELAVLNRTIGVLFSGYTCSMTLYGFLFFRQYSFSHPSRRKAHPSSETYNYFTDYPNDPYPLRILVSADTIKCRGIF